MWARSQCRGGSGADHPAHKVGVDRVLDHDELRDRQQLRVALRAQHREQRLRLKG